MGFMAGPTDCFMCIMFNRAAFVQQRSSSLR